MMQYCSYYNSKIGKILLIADELGIINASFDDNYNIIEEKNENILLAEKWLNIYFSGNSPDFYPPIHMIGTEFQKNIWNILLEIPYGKILSYSDLALIYAKKMNIKRMSAQAIGGALKNNKILIFIPCHRIIGKNNSLIGYKAGIWRKKELIKLENSKFIIKE